MGFVFKLFALFSILSVAFLIFRIYPCLLKCYELPDLQIYKIDGYFGPQKVKANFKPPQDPTQIQPFKINISQSTLDDLQDRLRKSRFINHLIDTKFNYGFNSEFLRKVQQHWLQKYNWRTFEKQLNQFPQFKTKIEGLDIHFLHVKPNKSPKLKATIPVIMVHGWPGSFWEYTKIAPLLAEPDSNGVAFEMIIPSIPGYGYSEAPHHPGFNAMAATRIFVKLMKRLGHERFFAHGGDWGNLIAKSIGTIYPENTRGVHLIGNFFQPLKPCHYFHMALGYLFPQYYFGGDDYQKQWEKMFPFGEKVKFFLRETGYMHIQATKPDSVGSALVDSPIGLAAYILEKFSTWTDPQNVDLDDGGLTSKFSLDDLLTNVMIYWTSGNIASSQRFYYENLQNYDKIKEFSKWLTPVPVGTLDTAHDLQHAPKQFVRLYYENLVQYSELDHGGHFVAFEDAKAVADDFRMFVDKVLLIEKQEMEAEAAKRKQQRKQEF